METETEPIAFAPAGMDGKDETATEPLIGCVAGKLETDTLEKGVNVESCVAVNTTGTELTARAWPNAGVLVSIEDRDVCIVVCAAEVDAPEGKGKELAEMG